MSCGDPRNTLVKKLGPTADKLRDLVSQAGLRPYRFRIIRERWSGGKRNQGVPEVTSTFEVTPTPKIADFNSLTEDLTPVGLDEVGEVQVSQISPRFTEDQLRGYGENGEPPSPDEEVFYEIEFLPTGSRQESIRRRFTLRGAPMNFPGRFEWVLRLARSRPDRRRDGSPG